jgi:hypothetical protein
MQKRFRLPFRRAIVVLAVAFVSPWCGAQTWSPSPNFGNVEQHQRLYDLARRWADAHFDPALNLIAYGSRDNPANLVHYTRESGFYAYGLLLTGKPEDRARAQAILRQVFIKQDLRKDQPTYGSFTNTFETDWAHWTKPDLNWGQFTGFFMAHIIWLDDHRHVLDPDVRSQLEQSFRLTVENAMHRDVDPHYTNIALLTAMLVSAGAKLENIPGAAEFAQKKLQAVYDMASQGTFCEYLSPTYYGGDFCTLCSAQRFACSDAFAELANRTLDLLWRDTAAAYHAPTYQLGGPHSRSYGDNMQTYVSLIKYFIHLGTNGKYPITDDEVKLPHGWDLTAFLILSDLPIEARPEFTQAPVPWREVLVYDNGAGFKRYIRQFRDGDFMLGTVSEKDEWEQCRNVVAYWPRPDGDHLGLCQDVTGRTAPVSNHTCDFYSTQNGPVVLAGMIQRLADQAAPRASRLMFNDGAKVTSVGESQLHYVIDSAPVEAVLYPITHGDGHLTVQNIDGGTCLDRNFSTGDPAGKETILGYVLAFRLPGQKEPDVKELSLQTGEDKATLMATVNGTALSLDVPYKPSPLH